jgi:hypothetical protein
MIERPLVHNRSRPDLMSTSTDLSPTRLPASLEENRIASLPPGAYYIADFITEEEEQAILRKVTRSALFQRAARSLTV